MADNYSICTLLGAMDHLWFHQIILPPKSPKTPPPISESFTSNQSSSSCTSIPEEQDSLSSDDESAITPQQDDDSEIEEREKIIEVLKKTRPSRLNIVKTHSTPSSPSSSSPNNRRRYSGSVTRLQRTMSCKSLSELEVEEVKGFMDLGFRFDTQHLCPRMMTVVPGLQRLGICSNMLQRDMLLDDKVLATNNRDEEDEVKTMRPYLSEAWLIRRPDSPLLNLRIPRASAAADMKKHLKHWAKTVASVIQQES